MSGHTRSSAPPAVVDVPVWSRAVRLGHAALAGCVLTALFLHEGGRIHEWVGYAAGTVVVWRLMLGWRTRDPYARFGAFVRSPAQTWAYARALMAGREPHVLGHNPLGGWMIVALLACTGVAAASGALYATDQFWGDPIVYALHQGSGWGMAVLATGHVAGVVFTSWRQRENLVRSMLTGRKRQPHT